MSATNRTGLIRNAVMAAILGSTVGGAIGVWSLRRPAVTVGTVTAGTVTTTPPARVVTTATETANRPAVDVTAGSSKPNPQPPAAAPQPSERRTGPAARPMQAPVAAAIVSAATPSPSARTTEDEAQVLQRAVSLARRPDVAALIALREGVAHRAAERGLADSPATKSELDELDQRLNEARMLQLKLDAEEIRKADSKRPR
jgi:hypothetical protein